MDIYRLINLYKATLDERKPFEGEMLTQIKDYYRIGLTWSSNAIEGNTLTESETKILIEDGLSVGGKPLRYTFEAIGHCRAGNRITKGSPTAFTYADSKAGQRHGVEVKE